MAATDTAAPANTPAAAQQDESIANESGAFDVLKRRLAAQGEALGSKAQALNAARIAEFGQSASSLAARLRVRTENNCIARDVVQVGDLLIFGYNVFIGLRKETQVADVFSLYRVPATAAADELEPVALENSFLAERRFVADFRELYAYYKNATLTQLRVNQQKLLAAFRIGQQVGDLRVFRWAINNDGSLTYIDNRGERDIALPPAHDFEWTATTREDHVNGKYAHINILDTVFVETMGGDLTVKIENNTESGRGIYSEPVDEAHQALGDAEVSYAKLGGLILLSVKPYREQRARYLVYNTRTESVLRVDAVGDSCVQLPEDHGIIYPGGCLLQSGESKAFELGASAGAMRFKRQMRSPNGEDVLYVFYDPASGRYALFIYNLITKALSAPILTDGYARFDDGRILVFQKQEEPSRSHAMQVWHTPFVGEGYAQQVANSQSAFARIGNAELVRGVSDLLGIVRSIAEQTPTRTAYADLIRQCTRVADAYFWLSSADAFEVATDLKAITQSAQATLDEFEKVAALKREAIKAFDSAQKDIRLLASELAGKLWREPGDFVNALSALRGARGRLAAMKERRFVDAAACEREDVALGEEEARVGQRALQFLAQDSAFASYRKFLADSDGAVHRAATSQELDTLANRLNETGTGLDLLTQLASALGGGDATLRTSILDRISLVYADVNRLRAQLRNKRKALVSTESAAEFGAQLKLLTQSVENALETAQDPAACDEALTRLITQLESLEAQFGQDEQFANTLNEKREAVYEALTAKKQALATAQGRRQQSQREAAMRILVGIPKRAAQCKSAEELHAYFAADALVLRVRQTIGALEASGASVIAGDLQTQLSTLFDQSLRTLRDRVELSVTSEHGEAIRIGRHQFAVSRQALDLTLLVKDGAPAWHLTGTDYWAKAEDARLASLSSYWPLEVGSESPELYRAEFLAGMVEDAATRGGAFDLAHLHELLAKPADEAAPLGRLEELVRQFAAPRFAEGYQRGIHDRDAARLLAALLPMQAEAGLLKHGGRARALALLYWAGSRDMAAKETLKQRAANASQLATLLGASHGLYTLAQELGAELFSFGLQQHYFTAPESSESLAEDAAHYLIAELARAATAGGAAERWILSADAQSLVNGFTRDVMPPAALTVWKNRLGAQPLGERFAATREWLLATAKKQASDPRHADEAACALLLDLPREPKAAQLATRVEGLLGEHARIQNGVLDVQLNDFRQRFLHHTRVTGPGFAALISTKQRLIERERVQLRLEQFQAKPLAGFVRNRLIDEVFLPLIGDNLAKQIGAQGAAAQNDRMGLLLLISPPGYGKTTLMEYVADRLGLNFVRINGPALGHDVRSLDPQTAPHAAAREELEKLNLGLMMGSNTMLYIDDIQHTHPEFLQKFIGLCDATRRIEGIWRGQSVTHDLRGKRFAVVMAGNPYTESGEAFKVPDMLANRADIYNLGDSLSGREALFALSYLENSLAANPVLRPLANREPAEVRRLIRLAEGEEPSITDAATPSATEPLSAAAQHEMVEVLKRLVQVRGLLMQVNAGYIASAAQADAYRTEPPFKLQGSYRNMAKLAAKVTASMTPDEVNSLLRDHYRGEAQTLTSGAEENLLKLALMTGAPTAAEKARWETLCDEYRRQKKLGGNAADGTTRVANLLADIAVSLDKLGNATALRATQKSDQAVVDVNAALVKLADAVGKRMPSITIQNATPHELANAVDKIASIYEQSLAPLIAATHHKLSLDHKIWEQVGELSKEMKRVVHALESPIRAKIAPEPAKTTKEAAKR